MVSNGRTYFYHADTCGHILCLTDEQGNISASYAYDPFGNTLEETGSVAHSQPFTYCGLYGVMREGGGLYFMKRRYYDSVTGRFIQKDPIGILGGTNVYTYAGNNPVTYMDPEGLLAPVIVAGIVLIAIGGAAVTLNSQNRTLHIVNNVLSGANEYISAPQAPGAYDAWMNKIHQLGNLQEAAKDDVYETQTALWDKFATLHPAGWETHWGGFGLSNVYSSVKAAYATVTGEWFDAVRNWVEAIPGDIGQLQNAANNWYDAWIADQDNKCK
jgi:RHS repeat-associated protein